MQPNLIDVGGGTAGGNAGGTAPGTADGAPADALSVLLERMEAAIEAGHPVSVNLARITPAGREPVKRFDGDSFDPFVIGEQYGAGRYLARLKVAGKFVANATFPAAGPARGAVAGAPAPAPAAAGAAPVTMPTGDLTTAQLFTALMSMTQAQMAAQSQLLSAILTRDTGPKLAEILPLLKPERSNVGELIAGLRELRDIAPEGDGGGGGGGSDLADLAALFGPMFSAMANQPAGGAARPMAAPARRALPAGARRLVTPAPTPAPPTTPAAPAVRAPAEGDAPALRLVRPEPAAAKSGATPAQVRGHAAAPDTGSRVVQALRAAWRLGLMPDTAAGMAVDVLEAADDGEQLAAVAAGAEGPAMLAVLIERAPEFAADPARTYALEALEALRDYLTADDEGTDDEGDEESADDGGDDGGAGAGDDDGAGAPAGGPQAPEPPAVAVVGAGVDAGGEAPKRRRRRSGAGEGVTA